MARRSEHTMAEIKDMILNAAEAIVIEEGLSELKVRKIALEIGYTVGSVYMVFDNMADLAVHLKGRTLDDINRKLESVDPNQEPYACIVALAKNYLQFADENMNRWRMIFEYQNNPENKLPDWYLKKVDVLFEPLENQISRIIPNSPDAEAKQIARTLWSGIHGICFLSLTNKLKAVRVDGVEDMIILLIDNFLKGLVANK